MHRQLVERSPVKLDTTLTYCHYTLNDTSLTGYLPLFKQRRLGVINASVRAFFDLNRVNVKFSVKTAGYCRRRLITCGLFLL